MSYFEYFNTIDYDIFGTGVTKKLTNITNYATVTTKLVDDVTFYSFYNIPDGYRPDNVSYELYDTVDYYWTFFLVNPKLKNYYDDWPKPQAEFNEFVQRKYSGVAALTNDTIAGEFTIGETVIGQVSGATGILTEKYPTEKYLRITPTSGTFREEGESIRGISSESSITAESIPSAAFAPSYYIDIASGERTRKRTAGVQAFTFYELENQKNIENSKIRVIKPEFITQVVEEFSREMKKT